MLPQYRAQRGLGEHVRRRKVILDLNDRPLGVDDIEIQHRVNLHRDIVVGDHVLGRYFDNLDAQIDPHHFLEERYQQHKSRTLTF